MKGQVNGNCGEEKKKISEEEMPFVRRDTSLKLEDTERCGWMGSGQVLIRMTSCPLKSPGPAHAP